MRVAFMGTPEFALPMLERLIASSHQIVCVVTQPDRPAGRGHALTPPPVKVRALEAGLTVVQPEKLRAEKFHETLREFGADVAVVVAYGKILPKQVLETPRHGCLNIHASLLPKYRGAAPIQRAIAAGEETTGVTIMQLDEGMDTGPVVCAEPVEICDDDDSLSLGNMLSVLGAELMMRTLDRLEAEGRLDLTPQDESAATYAPPIKREDARIDWSAGNLAVICLVRAMTPWPVAFTVVKGVEWKVMAVEPFTTSEGDPVRPGPEVKAGQVISLAKGRGIAVATGSGSVLLTRVQLPGRRVSDAADVINSRVLREGDVLGA